MKSTIALRVPCGAAAALDTSVTNVASNAYAVLQTAANMSSAASAVYVSNSGTQPIILATGAAASEVNTGIVIPPLCQGILIPIKLNTATRMSLKSLGGTQVAGFVSIMFLQ